MAIRESDLLGPRSARRRKKARSGRLRRAILLVLLLLGLVIAGGFLYATTMVGVAVNQMSAPLPPEVAPQARPAPVVLAQHQPINILLMGLDNDQLRSDVLMLISVDTDTKHISVLQIPRDTRALLAGKGTFDKINAAYAFGVSDKQFPANLRALKTVEDLLDITINYTVVVKLDGFRRIIDAIGGVWVDIPRKMDYDDPDQDLHIHFQPGRQKLDGKKALEFVRWRHNNDGSGYPDQDLGRIRTQQQFLGNVLAEMLKPANLIKLPTQILTLSRYIDTTIEVPRLASLAAMAASLRQQDVEFATLPGTDAYLMDPQQRMRLSYFLPDPDGTRKLVDRMIRGIDPQAAARVKVQVVSAGRDDLAAQLAARLSEQGFSVVQATSRGKVPEKTRVTGLTADEAKSQLVGGSLASLGVSIDLLNQAEDSTEFDVRVELGRDFL